MDGTRAARVAEAEVVSARDPAQPELFDIQGAPYVRESETSLEAARSVLDSVGGMERFVLDYLRLHGEGGATVDEIEVALNMLHQTAGARTRGLVLKGFVKDSGERRLTRSGRRAVVWVAT